MAVSAVHYVFGCLRYWKHKALGKKFPQFRLHGQEKGKRTAVFVNKAKLCSTELAYWMAYRNLVNRASLLSLQGLENFVSKEALQVSSGVFA